MTKKSKLFLFLVIIAVAALVAGALLRLFFFRYKFPRELAELTFQDPLFWDHSLDPDKMESSVKRLRAVENEFKKFDSPEAIQKNEVLFLPFLFLEELPKVGRATRTFLNEPNVLNAKALLSHYDGALSAYEKEVERLAIAYARIFPTEPGFGNDLTANLPLLKKNAASLREEINQRKACAATGACQVRFLPLAAPKLPSLTPPRLPDALLFPRPEYFSKLGLVRVPSECWNTASPWHEIYLAERRFPSEYVPSPLTKLADENLYLRMPDRKAALEQAARGAKQRVLRFNDVYSQEGLSLRLLRDSSFTRCTDLTHYPKAFTLLWLQKELKSAAVVRDLKEDDFPPKAREALRAGQIAEETIGRAETPSWDQAVQLANSLQFLLELENQKELRLPEDRLRKVSKIHSAIASALPEFDQVLDSLADHLLLGVLVEDWKGSDSGIPSPPYRLTRMHFLSVTYLPFSRSTWRISDSIQYPRKEPPGASIPVPSREEISRLEIVDAATGTPRLSAYHVILLSQIRHLFTLEELIEITRKSFDLELRFWTKL